MSSSVDSTLDCRMRERTIHSFFIQDNYFVRCSRPYIWVTNGERILIQFNIDEMQIFAQAMDESLKSLRTQSREAEFSFNSSSCKIKISNGSVKFLGLQDWQECVTFDNLGTRFIANVCGAVKSAIPVIYDLNFAQLKILSFVSQDIKSENKEAIDKFFSDVKNYNFAFNELFEGICTIKNAPRDAEIFSFWNHFLVSEKLRSYLLLVLIE